MRSIRTIAALALSVLLPAALGQTGASARGVAGARWRVQSSPSFGSSLFNAVTSLRHKDTWAVGQTVDHKGNSHTLVEHFDGTGWTRQPSPDPGPNDGLSGVAAASSADVWAVGSYDASGGTSGVILHDDGSGWTTAELEPGASALTSVAVHGARNAWAVGQAADGESTYVLHWNGTRWKQQASPTDGVDELTSVSATSASDVWAVGSGVTSGGGPLILHYDGSAWGIQETPPIPGPALESVSALSPTDVWAVGSYQANGDSFALILHWDGVEWSQVPASPTGTDAGLQGVWAVASDDVWAVGLSHKVGSTRTLIEHWDGVAWGLVDSPNVGGNSQLMGVASSSSRNSFAVGYSGILGASRTLALRCAC